MRGVRPTAQPLSFSTISARSSHSEQRTKQANQRQRVGFGVDDRRTTGGASCKGCDTDAIRRRVEADIDYIQTWSILKDAKIVLLTIPSLLIAENAY